MPRLVVVKGADRGKQFDLSGAVMGIGRHSSNAIHLHDTRISRKHLELRKSGSGYRLVDLGSGNGTHLNERLVQSAELRPGDRIALGETILLFADSHTPTENDDTAAIRLSFEPDRAFQSSILRSIPAEAGTAILSDPTQANTDWLRSRLANLAVMYEAANAVSNILDVDELLERIMSLILHTADADQGCFMIVDAETGVAMPKAVRARDGSIPKTFSVSRTVVEYVMRERKGILVSDAATDDRFRGGESIARHHIREVLCVPMCGRHEMVGAIFLDTHSGGSATPKFTDGHLQLAVAIAHQSALAVEETRYYQALVNAERLAAVGQTIAGMSHHIKNIMQGVRFGASMVRMGLDGDRELLTKGWTLVEKNQARIDELILDMLNFSKEREPSIHTIDAVKLIEDVLEIVKGRLTERGIALVFVPPVSFPPVMCDPEGIHRALLNIVGNAIDAIEDQPVARLEVSLRLSEDGQWVELDVTDNGPGVPADKVEEIFKPFVSTKGNRGTGLGLPVSRKVLREHGGDLTAEGLPSGSRFRLRLPLRR